jgi:hypothetical protein
MQAQPERTHPDSQRISLSGYPVIADWCKALGCSEVELAEAIGVVGDSAAQVRKYLAKRPGGSGRSPPSP